MAAGETTVEIGLMWLLVAVDSDAEARTALSTGAAIWAGEARERLEQGAALLSADPGMFETVRSVAAAVDHDDRDAAPEALLVRLRRGFDRAAAISPDAAAALYSLGDAGRLQPVTSEVVGWMRVMGLPIDAADILEVGCGPGRYLAAFAKTARRALGVELSTAMAQEAARRLSPWPNAAAVQGSGRDLACVADAAFDLVLYADSFPYVMQAGGDLPARHLAEAARVLRPDGRLLVLNWSYEGSLAGQTAQAGLMAAEAGFVVDELGSRPFKRWDGAAFLFTRRQPAAT